MRADLFIRDSRLAGRFVLLLLTSLLLTACKTETESADPVIIGVPQEDAYLGVEYFYNFGAVDKDDILDYSLTNAPSWLALEDTTNKARQGIIMRGVPGITGGQRGRDDLGRSSRINLVGNDRVSLGAQSFTINVQENLLSAVSRDYSEAAPDSGEEDEESRETPDFQCKRPFTGARGEHTFQQNTYTDTGSVDGVQTRTSTTQPVLVTVNLDQPSVTRIDVAFELRSNFDPSRCDSGFSAPHQRCDTGLANANEAAIGRDIIALGSGSGPSLPVPDYLEYQQDENGRFSKGVLTLEPGITECFVRLEVIDDLEPERLESFTFALTEVRSGIAGLGPSNTEVREAMRIEDNEPVVRLETLRGGKRDVINLSPAGNPGDEVTAKVYRAVIDGDREQSYFVKLGAQSGSDAMEGSDFFLELENPDFPAPEGEPEVPEWVRGDLIEFPPGTDEVMFRVRTASVDSFSNPSEDDRFVLLGPDSGFQAGRSNFAASDPDDVLRISINQLDSVLAVGTDTGFIPTDMTLGQNGRIFLAGYDSSAGNSPMMRAFDQKGDLVSEISLYPRGIALEAPPVIGFAARDVDFGSNNEVLRHELAIAFGVEEDEAGNPTPGDINLVTQRWYFDTALTPSDYSRDWQLISGTDRDDLPRWIGIEPTSGDVLVSGVTKGLIEPDQILNGSFGSFVKRIDTREDGAERVPAVAWQRKVESVSHDERVVGGGIQSVFPIVMGDSRGSVGGEPQSGGRDAFFYSARNASEAIDVQQVGTARDENLVDGFFDLNMVWLTGNGDSEYRVVTEQGVRVLRQTPTNSSAGFLLGYTPAGSAMESYLLNDEQDLSSETLRAAIVFDDDLIAGGATDGTLTADPDIATNTLEDPALFRRNRQPRFEEDEDDDPENDDLEDKTLIVEPSQEWAQQVSVDDPGTGIVEALANYRNDEITALVRKDLAGGSIWGVYLFNAEGDRLNR